MKIYTYSQASKNLSKVLNRSKGDEVLIKSRGGDTFAVIPKKRTASPFDVQGVKTETKTSDILRAVRESRSRETEYGS